MQSRFEPVTQHSPSNTSLMYLILSMKLMILVAWQPSVPSATCLGFLPWLPHSLWPTRHIPLSFSSLSIIHMLRSCEEAALCSYDSWKDAPFCLPFRIKYRHANMTTPYFILPPLPSFLECLNLSLCSLGAHTHTHTLSCTHTHTHTLSNTHTHSTYGMATDSTMYPNRQEVIY